MRTEEGEVDTKILDVSEIWRLTFLMLLPFRCSARGVTTVNGVDGGNG